MNRARAKELLPIIQAFADGKKIQFKLPEENEWLDMDFRLADEFPADDYQYRIKPEPKVREVIE